MCLACSPKLGKVDGPMIIELWPNLDTNCFHVGGLCHSTFKDCLEIAAEQLFTYLAASAAYVDLFIQRVEVT